MEEYATANREVATQGVSQSAVSGEGGSIKQPVVLPGIQYAVQFPGEQAFQRILAPMMAIQQPLPSQIFRVPDGNRLVFVREPVTSASWQVAQNTNGTTQTPSVSFTAPVAEVFQADAVAGPERITVASASHFGCPGRIYMPIIQGSGALPGAQMIQQPSEVEPILVNPKQYHRILKRREARDKLEAAGKITKRRRKYCHESRHRHAMNRVRSERGRFASHTVEKELATQNKSPVYSKTNTSREALRGNIERPTEGSYKAFDGVKVKVEPCDMNEDGETMDGTNGIGTDNEWSYEATDIIKVEPCETDESGKRSC